VRGSRRLLARRGEPARSRALTEYEPISNDQSVVTSVTRRDVDGWAFDAGLNWLLALPFEPRIFAGYALASHWFRQTGPTRTRPASAACSACPVRLPARSGAQPGDLDGRNRLLAAALGSPISSTMTTDCTTDRFTWNAELELQLTVTARGRARGRPRARLEEWERFEFDVAVAAFHPGAALGTRQGRWSYGSFVAVRFAF
jgi:hypothetical protein